MGNTGDCPNWCPLCSHPKRPCSISGCPSHFVSHPLSFHSVCLFIAVFLSSLILFVDVTPLCPGPLFRLCFLSLTAERKKSGSWHPKTPKVEMLNENTDKAKKKKTGCRGPNRPGSMHLSPQERHFDSLLCSHIL